MNDNKDKTCSTGLSEEVSILLAYLFLWLGGIIFLFAEKKNKFVRFHAMQSIILSLAAAVLLLGLSILQIIPLLGFFIIWIIKPLFVAAFWVLIILMIIKINGGQDIRIPVISETAEQFLEKLEKRRTL
jgi:uncharacterized membrane protein